MSVAINRLVKLITQKPSLQDLSMQDLQQIADRYPYFSAIHLLLSKKSAENGKTTNNESPISLYFPDPLWLECLLQEKGTVQVEKKQKDQTVHSRAFEPAFTAERTVAVPEPSLEVHKLSETEKPEVYSEKREEIAIELPTETAKNEEIAEEIKEPVSMEEIKETLLTEDIKEPVTIKEIKETITTEDSKAGSSETLSTTEMMNPESQEKVSPPENGTSLTSAIPQSVSSDITFEPFHTVDYFASQGIKITEEEKPKDKFGQQLKSFTEWLKTLKKAPAPESAGGSNLSEQKVERMAAHSLADREVVTEAMAEVWEKQGNHAKALAVYEKLSLLNPSKSSYFAAKIEQLKKS